MMTKNEMISEIYRRVLNEQRVFHIWGQNKTLMILYPSQVGGVRYPNGIQTSYWDGYNRFVRQFYFPQIMEEQFRRYLNSKFTKPDLKHSLRMNDHDLFGNVG